MSQKQKNEIYAGKNLAEMVTNPLLLLPLSVVATLMMNYIIGSMEPIKAISIAIIILLFAVVFSYIAKILFYQFLKLHNINDIGELLSKLDSASKEISKHLSNFDIQNSLLSENEINEIEKNSKEIWVASRNLKYDRKNENIKQLVAQNLSSGKVKYFWIVPDSHQINTAIAMMQDYWKRHSVDYTNATFIKIPSDKFILSHDITIYDATHGCADTQVIEFIVGNVKSIGYRLPEETCEDMIGIIKNWIDDKVNIK